MTMLPDTDGLQLDLHSLAQKVTLNLDRRNQSQRPRRATRTINIPIQLGSPGLPLSVGSHIFFRLNLGGPAILSGWSLGATAAGIAVDGEVTLDIQVGTTLATVASIVGANLPELIIGNLGEVNEQPVGEDWVTAIPAPSTILVTATIVDGIVEVVSLTLQVQV